MRSIGRYLLGWILGALDLGSVLVAMVTYLVTLEEMNEVFDSDLRNIARPVVQGEQWIVYSSAQEEGVAQAAQRMAARIEIAEDSAMQVVPPLLALVVIVGALLIFGLRRGLRPLDSATLDITNRSATSLEPITAEDVPREIAPLVAAIDGLMARLAASFQTQRRFMADAAHELRIPITALRLQLQRLKRSGDESRQRRAMEELEAGIDRSQRLVEQLLLVA